MTRGRENSSRNWLARPLFAPGNECSRASGGEIRTVEISEQTIVSWEKQADEKTPQKIFRTVRVPDGALVDLLKESNLEFYGYLIWSVLSRRMGKGLRSGVLDFGKKKAKIYGKKEDDVSFDDVAGVEEAKEELVEAVPISSKSSWGWGRRECATSSSRRSFRPPA